MTTLQLQFVVPNSNPALTRIELGCGLELNFVSGHVFFIRGNSAQDTAQAIADAINFDSTALSIVNARNLYNLRATYSDRYVNIELDYDDACCGENFYLYDDENNAETWQPPRGAYVVECQAVPPGLDEIDCTQYRGKHVYRFKFVNPGGVLFGVGATDYRYVIDVIAGILSPPCFLAPSYYYLLSPSQYATEAEFFDGWASAMASYIWASAYGGTVTHLGTGIMEVVTDIETWNNYFAPNPPPPLCSGLGVNCGYVGSITNPGFDIQEIVQGCCPIVPEVPPPDPEYDPPTDPPIAFPGFCLSIPSFLCCAFGAPGIQRVIAIDRKVYEGICLDADGKIIEIKTGLYAWTEFCFNFASARLTATEERDNNGYRYVHRLTMSADVMSQENRNALMHLANRPLMVIIEDKNNRYWMLGEDYPARVRAHKSDTAGTNHTYEITDTSRKHIREVLKEYVEGDGAYYPGIIIGEITCDDLTPEGDVPLDPLRPCFLFDKKDLFLNN